MINRFDGKYFFLDNFYTSFFTDKNGLKWKTVEHYFQAHKSVNRRVRLMIKDTVYPGKAKQIGNSIELRNDWETVKYAVMERGLKYKFDQNPDLKRKLINTGVNMLIEGNYHHDNIWGDCFCPKCRDIEGKNNLGKLLMKIRGEYKENEG